MKRIVNKLLLNSYHDEPCTVCKKEYGTVAHHIKTKGSGGHDVESNLMPLCVSHHDEVHKKGLNYFADKYYRARLFLLANNWELFNGKWINKEKFL